MISNGRRVIVVHHMKLLDFSLLFFRYPIALTLTCLHGPANCRPIFFRNFILIPVAVSIHVYQQLLVVVNSPILLLKWCRLNISSGVTRSGLHGTWSNKCWSRQRQRWKNRGIISIGIRRAVVVVEKFGVIWQRDIRIKTIGDIGIKIIGTVIWSWLVLKSITLLRKGMMSQCGVWRTRILHVNVLKWRWCSKCRFG